MLAALRRSSSHEPTFGSSISEVSTQSSISGVRPQYRRSTYPKTSISFAPKLSSLKLGRSRAPRGSISAPDRGNTRSLADLFFSLPNELQVYILLYLSPRDILSCRSTSSAFHGIVNVNQNILARQMIPQILPPDCSTLYQATNYDIKCLVRMLHRHVISSKLAATVADFVAHEIMRLHTKAKRLSFEDDWQRIHKKMVPLLFTIYHFLEVWRERILELPHDQATNYVADTTTILELLDSYEPHLLLATEQMYILLRQTLARQLRPPTYASGVERAFRGWTQTPPSVTDIQVAIAVGGLDVIQKVLSKKTYGDRTRTLDMFLKKVVPTENVKWHVNWQSVVHGPYAEQESPVRPPSLRLWSCVKDEYSSYPWDASTRLVERGIITDASKIKRPREFISELLGYDVLTRQVIQIDGDTDSYSLSENDADMDSVGPADDADGWRNPSSTEAWWE